MKTSILLKCMYLRNCNFSEAMNVNFIQQTITIASKVET